MFILKYIKIVIFNIFYGKIKKIITTKNNLNIKIKKIVFKEKFSYNIFEIKNARLYNASVHDCAIILNNNLIDEVSLQFRYNTKKNIINGLSSENIVLKTGTPKIKKNISATVFSTLTGGAGKHNYFHWLFDVLPRIAILEKSIDINEPDFYLLPSLKHPYQKQTLEKLNIPFSKLLNGEKSKHFSCDKLITTDHPYVFNNDPSQSILSIPHWIVEWLKKKFESNNLKSINFSDKIYIDRNDSINKEKRFIINNSELREHLKKLGFQILVLSDLSFANQVEIFRNSKIVIGLHGAGFANVIFSKPGTKVIELQSKTAGNIVCNLCVQCNLNYKKISVDSKNSNLMGQQGSIHINLNELDKIIFDN